ncbi:mechanosensitive ion channel family protein [Dehalobacter restrictus]|uniref:Mechanosensitive ion channel protein n=1 Tax=Dehalobacter restrictus (strain DSM 9455 / PER-K23) TaxID=871738 RepID=A0ABM5P2L8_DEHRP|nr:mechanosensitive ion channel family protein [Dehalobacter restrictus]AHF08751.1 mechanosensitive ion channel protein [Dehalobacter restrictus DSM 9455]
MPEYRNIFGNFYFFIIFRKIFSKYLFKIILKIVKKTPVDIVSNILLSFEKPIRVLFIVIGIYYALMFLPFDSNYYILFIKIFRSLIIILIGWGLYNLSSTSSAFFIKIAKRFDIEVDRILFPFISQLLRFVIVILVISIIASECGYNVGGFLAGLGLGGLAIALAAQDTIKNILGGIVIITEKPFTIGNWIKTPSVEGVVEDITFRSTKIRTFAQALVTVPNSTLANEAITNWTKMGKREINFNLGLAYSTPRNKIQTCVERISTMLNKHEDVDKELIIVRFNEFNESSLDIFLYFYTTTTSWQEYLRVKENANYKIMEILEQENVSVAFPSRSIYLEQSK